MTATTLLKAWDVTPNSEIKTVVIMVPNTTDENDTFTFALDEHGISATGLLTIRSWVHTTSGSIIVTDIATCSVSAGTVTVTLQSANSDSVRVVELMGRASLGVFV